MGVCVMAGRRSINTDQNLELTTDVVILVHTLFLIIRTILKSFVFFQKLISELLLFIPSDSLVKLGFINFNIKTDIYT